MTRRGFAIVEQSTGKEVHFVNCAGKTDRGMDRIYLALADRTDLDRFAILEIEHDADARPHPRG
jgi:hypothetical protein